MAALFAWAHFGEAIGPVQFTGAAIVLAGIYLSRKGS
jgi:drug/metabolite transporter (DMT)-like permease